MKISRLTGWDKGSAYYLKCFEGDEGGCEYMESDKCFMCDDNSAACRRLAEYEDTGLSPEEVRALKSENKNFQQWVNDLQSGMYVNCVYCGHRYGPADKVPISMAEALKKHIEQCPKHPMSKLKQENEFLKGLLKDSTPEGK